MFCGFGCLEELNFHQGLGLTRMHVGKCTQSSRNSFWASNKCENGDCTSGIHKPSEEMHIKREDIIAQQTGINKSTAEMSQWSRADS